MVFAHLNKLFIEVDSGEVPKVCSIIVFVATRCISKHSNIKKVDQNTFSTRFYIKNKTSQVSVPYIKVSSQALTSV